MQEINNNIRLNETGDVEMGAWDVTVGSSKIYSPWTAVILLYTCNWISLICSGVIEIKEFRTVL
jgi:hypothetical protein